MSLHPEEHFSRLQTLLQIEREEDRKQYQKKIQNRSVHDRKRDGVCWYPLQVRKSYLGLGEKWVIELERNVSDNERHLFQAGSSAGLFVNLGNDYKSSSGVISRISDHKMTIVLNRDSPPGWLDDGKIGVDLLFDESTYNEMDRMLSRLKKVGEGRLKELIRLLLGQSKPYFNAVQSIEFPYLNDSQNEAINHIRGAEDVALIHGPPGTGKTTTLVHAIIETVAHEKQVLICAPSNAAVDLLVEKLHEQDMNVVRLGHPARVTPEVISHTLDAQMANHPDAKYLKEIRQKSEEMRRLGKKYKRKYGYEEAQQRKRLIKEAQKLKDEALMLEDHIIYDVLNNASIIACTLVGANSSYLHNRTFKTVFIDESSQALEPAAWIPIARAQRVVMAGDHFQLPPTVKSLEAMKEGLEQTIFKRVIEKTEADIMLRTQYRMHPEIMTFSNEYFYEGKLETAESIHNRRMLFTEPLTFIDTAGCGYEESLNEESLSTFNTEEARFALQYLNRLLESREEEVFSIGMIAPYKAQNEKLNSLIHDFEWRPEQQKKININTVDAFQGQERDIICISLTRSNSRGEIGFLANERRMNVAMTRARHKLVMIGDSATLSSNPFFDKMIRFFQDKGSYHSAFEFLY
jgi:superfamily I DNA and/or RNA helicase